MEDGESPIWKVGYEVWFGNDGYSTAKVEYDRTTRMYRLLFALKVDGPHGTCNIYCGTEPKAVPGALRRLKSMLGRM